MFESMQRSVCILTNGQHHRGKALWSATRALVYSAVSERYSKPLAVNIETLICVLLWTLH